MLRFIQDFVFSSPNIHGGRGRGEGEKGREGGGTKVKNGGGGRTVIT